MLASLSIRAKISIVVTFLLLAMTGLGLLAIAKMRSINASAVDIQTNWLPSVRALGELRAGASNYRSILRGHMLTEGAAGKLEVEKRMQAQVERNDKTRQTYEKLISSPEERATYNEWAREWDAYMKTAQQVLALSRAQTAGGFPQEAVNE